MPLLKHMIQLAQPEQQQQPPISPRPSRDEKSNTRSIIQKTVLELGSGCGLVGMGLVAATTNTTTNLPTDSSDHPMIYQYSVVMTDQSTEWLQHNCELNRDFLLLAEKNNAHKKKSRIEIRPLPWGNFKDMQDVLQTLVTMLPDNTPHRQMNEYDEEVPVLGLDYIVGSDLLYNPASHAALLSTLQFYCLASVSSPQILLAHPQRHNNEEIPFVDMAQSKGFTVKTQPLLVMDNNSNSESPQIPDKQQECSLLTLVYKGGNDKTKE